MKKENEPKIISAPTIYWEPSTNISYRRKREKQRHNEVSDYLETIGFSPYSTRKHTAAIMNHDKIGEIKVLFEYYENSKNVIKHFEVYRNGKLSNIQTLRKLYPKS